EVIVGKKQDLVTGPKSGVGLILNGIETSVKLKRLREKENRIATWMIGVLEYLEVSFLIFKINLSSPSMESHLISVNVKLKHDAVHKKGLQD
ncbi:hypothetical protein Tco_1388476, partial [Tanacetum coccineum]